MNRRNPNDIAGYREDGTSFTFREWDLEYTYGRLEKSLVLRTCASLLFDSMILGDR